MSAVTKQFMRDSQPKIHSLILMTGAMTKSLCLEERPIRFDCTMRFKQIVIKAIEMFGKLTVSGLYHSTDCVL